MFNYVSKETILILKAEGLNQAQIAKRCGVYTAMIQRLATQYEIKDWAKGAAARDQIGKNNPAFVDGLSRSTVRRATKKIIEDANINQRICQKCSKYREIPWPIHHIDANRANNILSNLIVICVSCHNLEHRENRAKINMDIANEIRAAYCNGNITMRQLAKKYDLSSSHAF